MENHFEEVKEEMEKMSAEELEECNKKMEELLSKIEKIQIEVKGDMNE